MYILDTKSKDSPTLKKVTPLNWFVVLALLACGLALGLPPDPQTLHQLHISSFAYRVAVTLLLIPYAIIWYTAFYAFSRLKEYSVTIDDSEDGKAFSDITAGMGVLAFGLVVPTILSLIMQNIVSHDRGFKPTSVIISNYLGLLVALGAFIYISNGAHRLSRISKHRPSLAGIRALTLLFVSLAVVFTHLVLSYHARHAHAYYLNTLLLIVTFIIPALFAWFSALFGAYETSIYTKFAKGLLYRSALRQFSYGIGAVVVTSVANQFLNNTIGAKVSHSLVELVLVDYSILVLLAFGLILMARGARSLKKIEEV